MPILTNQRHERFAQELAKGMSAAEAYRLAGYSDNDSNAARLNGNERVRARVVELQQMAEVETLVTIDRLTRELEGARRLAMTSPTGASAAVAAIMGKAKLHGLLIDRAEARNTNYVISDEAPSAEQWMATYGGSDPVN